MANIPLNIGYFEHMTSDQLLACMTDNQTPHLSHHQNFCAEATDNVVVYLPYLIALGMQTGSLVPMNVTTQTDYTGNGSFFDPFMTGELDFMLHYYTITMDRWNGHVKYSTPLTELERMFLARSKAEPLIPINFGILVPKSVSTLVISTGILLIIATSLSYMAIAEYYGIGRNMYQAVWIFARQIIPGNTTGFAESNPISMKFSIVTVGFLTLCFTSYYQSLLAESLIVKTHDNVDTVGELVDHLQSGESQVVLDHKGALYSMLIGEFSLKLAKEILIIEDPAEIKSSILDNNAILMHSTEHIMSIINEMPYPECTQYRLAKYRPYQQWNAIVFGNDMSKEMEELINGNIMIRRDAMVRIVERRGNMVPKCRAHFFPEFGAFVGYDELSLKTVSGAFILLAGLLLCCVLSFVAENVHASYLAEAEQRRVATTETCSDSFCDVSVDQVVIDGLAQEEAVHSGGEVNQSRDAINKEMDLEDL